MSAAKSSGKTASGTSSSSSSSTTSSTTGNPGSSIPGVQDLLGLLGGGNPLIAVGRAVETVMQVASDIVTSIGTFNDTMNELNKVAHRVNSLLDEIEKPVADIVPLVHASAKQAKATLKRVDSVLNQVGSLPGDITKAISTLGDLAGRLGPLAQFAEAAGGVFGIKPPSK